LGPYTVGRRMFSGLGSPSGGARCCRPGGRARIFSAAGARLPFRLVLESHGDSISDGRRRGRGADSPSGGLPELHCETATSCAAGRVYGSGGGRPCSPEARPATRKSPPRGKGQRSQVAR
jgi:hypothetical protein